ncbi:hypothetical protein POM88_052818 [Heracleum sosnowskyi]|uniref:F-box associated beta-propeller type 3 domain-containing protein n=1 Tax=Heracleum sosnowskyi TaxID=360622 RepID=A0AAD8LWC8_9APIA|nr:hypothetical protein POM88_052818 [Heracleum sosnowskyi]
MHPTVIDLSIRKIFGYPSSVNLYIIACQVTGWIVAFRYEKSRRTQPSIIYQMYNPVTGQHIVVPQPKRNRRRRGKQWHGHALILAQKTNQLKLLEFCNINGERQVAHIQAIGTNEWRSIGEVPCQRRGFHQPVLLNGQCHWFDIDKCVINCFNVEEEVFEAVYETPYFEYSLYPEFGLLHGCLCLTTHSHQTEVWVMKEYGIRDSWTRTFVFDDIPFVKSLTCLENGEILMLGDHRRYRENKYATIICYNPRSRNCTRINVGDEVKDEEETLPQPDFFEVMQDSLSDAGVCAKDMTFKIGGLKLLSE